MTTTRRRRRRRGGGGRATGGRGAAGVCGVVGVLVAVGAASCAPGAGAGPAPRDLDAASAGGAVERDYLLAWRGARIGEARERERWDDAGVTLARRERVLVRRGGALAATETAIELRADRALVPVRVTWSQRGDAGARGGRAERAADGWRIEVDGEPPRRADADAVPEELVPLRVRRDGGFAGPVLLTGRGLAVARGEVVADGPGHLRATITTDAGALTAAIAIDRDGDALAIAASDGVVATRADEAALAAAFDPPEVVDTAAIAVAGAAGRDDDNADGDDDDDDDDAPPPRALALTGVTRAPPPALPGQRVVVDGTTWRVALDPAAPAALPPGRAPRDAAAVAALLATARAAGAHAAGPAPGPAPELAAGDCTARTLAFVARAAAAGVDVRVVTGWRLAGARLVRHRWALAWTGAAWLAVDPSFAEAPAAPRLVGLAVGGATAAELAVADLAFAGTEGATAAIAR